MTAFLQNTSAPSHLPTFAEILPQYLQHKSRLGLRWTTITNLRTLAGSIIRERGDQPIAEYTAEDFRDFVERRKFATATKFAAFLRWSHRRGYMDADITKHAFEEIPRVDMRPPAYWSPSDAHAFYHAASTEFRAAFALGMFAGMRPMEICRLRWEAIDPVGRVIRIDPSVSKQRRARIINGDKPERGGAPTILWAQLALHWRPTGFVLPRPNGSANESRAFKIWKSARLETAARAMVALPRNVMRHSFATFHVALTGNPALAARILGHAGLGILAAFYDGVTTRREAVQYFHPRPVLALPPPREHNES